MPAGLLGAVGTGVASGIGLGMVLLSTASMLLAAIVLALSDRALLRPAVFPGTAPLIALVGLYPLL